MQLGILLSAVWHHKNNSACHDLWISLLNHLRWVVLMQRCGGHTLSSSWMSELHQLPPWLSQDNLQRYKKLTSAISFFHLLPGTYEGWNVDRSFLSPESHTVSITCFADESSQQCKSLFGAGTATLISINPFYWIRYTYAYRRSPQCTWWQYRKVN